MATFKIGKLVMKSLFRKPATLMYPVVPREWQERTRGQISIREDDCIVCGICSKKCPANAITVDRKERTWTIERMQCVQCNCCVEVCPKTCLTMENQYTEPGPEKVVDTVEIPKQEKSAISKAKSADTGGGDAELKCDLDECIFCGLCSKNCPCDALVVDRKEKVWKVDAGACVSCGACVDKCPKKCLSLGDETAEAPENEPKEDKKAAKAETKKAEEPKEPEYSCPEDEGGLRCKLSDCIYCGLCAKACPVDALEIDRKEKLWKVDKDACVTCEACVSQCPKDCLEVL